MEAEERIGEEVIQRCPRAIPMVGEFRVGVIAREAVLFPLADIGGGDVLEFTMSQSHIPHMAVTDAGGELLLTR